MIPYTPLLLVAAAQALVRPLDVPLPPRPTRPVRYDGLHLATAIAAPPEASLDGGMSFIDHVGYWSHFDARLGVSAWPHPRHLALPAFLTARSVAPCLRLEGHPGDLVVRMDADGRPSAIGVVLATLHRIAGVLGGAHECHVAWGDPFGAPIASHEHCWLSPARGDRFIAWYLPPSVRDLALRRAA